MYFPLKNGQQPLFQIPGASSHQQVDVITDGPFQVIFCYAVIRLQIDVDFLQ